MQFGFAFVVFFQAEDGIRDLVRSRGLGDVYKRQSLHLRRAGDLHGRAGEVAGPRERSEVQGLWRVGAVSYTHLTLPTSDLV